MTYEQIILDEVKKDPVAKWAVEMYENEGYKIGFDNFTDTIDNITYVRVMVLLDSERFITSACSSLEGIKDFFRYQLDILRA